MRFAGGRAYTKTKVYRIWKFGYDSNFALWPKFYNYLMFPRHHEHFPKVYTKHSGLTRGLQRSIQRLYHSYLVMRRSIKVWGQSHAYGPHRFILQFFKFSSTTHVVVTDIFLLLDYPYMDVIRLIVPWIFNVQWPDINVPYTGHQRKLHSQLLLSLRWDFCQQDSWNGQSAYPRVRWVSHWG